MATAVEEKKRKERLSIYLSKDKSTQDNHLLKTENSNPPIPVQIGEEKAFLYVKKVAPKQPGWTKLFLSSPDFPKDAFGANSSIGAALVYRCQKNTFILTFGSGHHLIKDDAIERDFGLRVTLNSVEPEKLRSLDKASYEANPLNSRTQSTKDVDIFELHIDSELELLYAVTGASKIEEFGSQVTGRDAFTINVETDLNGIPKILNKCIEKYSEKLPKNFAWVDNINRVKDVDDIEILNLELDDALKAGRIENFWLGEPEIVDWEHQIGYSFDLYSNTPRHVTLRIEHFIDYLKGKDLNLSVASLIANQVHINNSSYQETKSWSVYRCLYAEITVGTENYILRNGTWFKVEPSFVKEIDRYLEDVQKCAITFPQYAHDREDDYNNHVASADKSFSLMDKKNTSIGGPYDKLEFCDLIKDDTNLVHVKYYRSSGTLSHLFAQGYVAAEAFASDMQFRENLNKKLPPSAKLTDTKARPSTNKYKVVYAIATTKEIPKDLPFFSKVTLKNAAKTLRALDFGVELAQIGIDPAILVKKKMKPKK